MDVLVAPLDDDKSSCEPLLIGEIVMLITTIKNQWRTWDNNQLAQSLVGGSTQFRNTRKAVESFGFKN